MTRPAPTPALVVVLATPNPTKEHGMEPVPETLADWIEHINALALEHLDYEREGDAVVMDAIQGALNAVIDSEENPS